VIFFNGLTFKTKYMQLKIILRNLFRDRLNVIIILVSLMIGWACVDIVAIFIFRELKTDSFHQGSKQIYALYSNDPWVAGQKMFYNRFGSAEYMKNNFSQVEDLCRVKDAFPQKVSVNHNPFFDQPRVMEASSNFFSFFSFSLISGNAEDVLSTGEDIVISAELAYKYFGHNDPIGQLIQLTYRNTEKKFVITGIFKKPIENSQLNFDMVCKSGDDNSQCYIKLHKGATKEDLEKICLSQVESIPYIHGASHSQYYLESLHDTYFITAGLGAIQSHRDKTDLWIAAIIGIMILSIAFFNTLGLINNRLALKAKELTLRRINGSSKTGLIFDFIKENLVLFILAFAGCIYLLCLFIPLFNQLLNTNINLKYVFQPRIILLMLAVVLITIFPVIVFSIVKIPRILNPGFLQSINIKVSKNQQLPVFNIFQIAVSVILIVASLTIIKQMYFISNKPIGINKEVIQVKLPGQYQKMASAFKEELQDKPVIDKVAVSSSSPVLEHWLILLFYQQDGVEKQYSPVGFAGDENFISTLGLQVIQGEGFLGSVQENQGKCLINESLARLFPGEDLVGKNLPGMQDTKVTGIVKDFHYSSLKDRVEPAYVLCNNGGNILLVKPAFDQQLAAKEKIAAVWQKLIPDYPLNTETIGERFESLHQENDNFIKLIGSCSLISIFLSMIGLFAISYQRSIRRTKEIGIRKVNGAGILEILAMFNLDFVRWVFIAFIVALPFAWIAMHKWLEGFAFKTGLSWWVFALSGTVALVISMLTISCQSWRAATRNPVEALRYE
jgi:putative ABC transport system permease protein